MDALFIEFCFSEKGTKECPVQNQFPTKQAIKQAKYRLMGELEKERCRYPAECVESIYRASYKTPPLNDAPKYCSKEQMVHNTTFCPIDLTFRTNNAFVEYILNCRRKLRK
jgi:hypothetical protein